MNKKISSKKIANGFYTARFPMLTFFAKYLGGKLFSFPGVSIITASNFEISRYSGFSYCYCVFIFGKLRIGLYQTFKVKFSSVFWSYKDTLILLSKKKKLVVRISGPRSAHLNFKNYQNLHKIYNINNSLFPTPISQKTIENVAVSCEQFLEPNLSVLNLPPKLIFEGLFLFYEKTHKISCLKKHVKFLNEYYRSLVPSSLLDNFDSVCEELSLRNYSQQDFFATGIIHGDLTVRNLVASDNTEIKYFDIDRLEESFPEFDFFTAFIDNEITSDGFRSYKRSLDLASKIGNLSGVLETLDWFYERMPMYAINRKNFELICSLFFIRTVAYVLSDSQFDERININEIFD